MAANNALPRKVAEEVHRLLEAEYVGLDVAARMTDPPTPIATLRYWVAVGKLKAHKPGRRVFVKRADLVALLEGGAR